MELTFGGAVALASGIGLQNFSGRFAWAMPLRRAGLKVGERVINVGQGISLVDAIAAVWVMCGFLPFSAYFNPMPLSFAAGV